VTAPSLAAASAGAISARGTDRCHDLVVVGGGAVGLAAAVRAAARGLSTVVVATSRPGGAVRSLARLDTVPGHPVGLTGAEYAERTVSQAIRFGVTLLSGAPVTSLIPSGDVRLVGLKDGRVLRTRGVLVATGVARSLPRIEGLREFLGAGVHTVLPTRVPETFRQGDVYITGVPRCARLAAGVLATECRTVTLLGAAARGFRRCASPPTRVLCRPRSQLQAVVGADHVEAVLIRESRAGRTVAREAAAVLVLLSGEPRSAWVAEVIARSEGGSVLTGEAARCSGRFPWPLTRRPFEHETTLPGVFAAGEVREGGAAGAEAVVESIEVVGEIMAFLKAPVRIPIRAPDQDSDGIGIDISSPRQKGEEVR
jgi:thioredoxin reductase (NADPH)